MNNTHTNLKTLVAIFFVVTGATGLIYQVTWFKYISLFVGNSTYAQMIVLSYFFRRTLDRELFLW